MWIFKSPLSSIHRGTKRHMVVSRNGGYPKMEWFVMEHPISLLKIDDLRVPLF